jgi:hypothetical protein
MAKTKKITESDLLDGIEDDTPGRGWKTQETSKDEEIEGKEKEETEFTPDPNDDVHDGEDVDPRPDPKPKKKPKAKVEDDLEEEEEEEEEEELEEEEPDPKVLEDEEEEEEEEIDDEENLESHSKKVQKRIQREIKLKKEAEARADEANERAYKSDVSAFEARKVTLEGMLSLNKRDIQDEKAKLKAAKEEDDTDAEVEAMTKISELQVKGQNIERGTESNKEPKKITRTPAGSPQATRWLERNRWFQNPTSFKSQIGYARVIDGELGADPMWKDKVGTSEYFAELDRQIHAKIPTLRVDIKKAYGGTTKKTKIVKPNSGTPLIKHKKSKDFKLDKHDRANALEFGLTTKAELDAYAAQKFKRIKAEGVQ